MLVAVPYVSDVRSPFTSMFVIALVNVVSSGPSYVIVIWWVFQLNIYVYFSVLL